MGIDYRFIKFTNYANELLEGKIYLNSLEYYRGVEKILRGKIEVRNDAINDFWEGSVASVNSNDFTNFGLGNLGEEFKDSLVGNVHLLSEGMKYLKLFCLYALLMDEEKKIVIAPSKKLYQFACEHAVIIHDVNRFRQRLFASLENGREKYKITEVKGDLVDYYDNDDKTRILGPFHKRAEFWWQHEFRLVFKEMCPNLNPMIIDIGDISDIAYCMKTKELLDNPQTMFPNYSVILEKDD